MSKPTEPPQVAASAASNSATVDPIMTALHDLLWIAHDHLTMADHTRFREAFAEIEKDRRAIDRGGGVVTKAMAAAAKAAYDGAGFEISLDLAWEMVEVAIEAALGQAQGDAK